MRELSTSFHSASLTNEICGHSNPANFMFKLILNVVLLTSMLIVLLHYFLHNMSQNLCAQHALDVGKRSDCALSEI